MTTERDLGRLFAAERSETTSADTAERGLLRLEDALASGALPMGVSLAPLSLGASATLKWSIGAGVIALVAGTAALTQPAAEPPRAPVVSSVATAPAVAAPPPAANPPETRVETPPPAPSSSANHVDRDAAFTEELRLVKLAKGEIDAGRAHLAEVWLTEHARRFPNGVFRTERDALRVLVICAADPTGGGRKARDFVRMNPRSPLVDRITRACLQSEPNAGESKIDK